MSIIIKLEKKNVNVTWATETMEGKYSFFDGNPNRIVFVHGLYLEITMVKI